jgi:hypothetical protein
LKGNLNKNAFYVAIQSVPTVFDAFRIRFDCTEPNSPRCFYDQDYSKLEVPELDFSNDLNPAEEAMRWMQKRFADPFIPGKHNLLFENVLIKIGANEYWLYLSCHHLISDGLGYVLWVNYLARMYRKLVFREETDFIYPAYCTEAVNAFEYKQSDRYKRDANYWSSRLCKNTGRLFQKKYQISETNQRSGTYVVDISREQTQLLQQLQLVTGSGLQQLTIAALLIYFGKHATERDFIFGLPIHRRGAKQLRDTMGMFSGVLPFLASYRIDIKLVDLLKEIGSNLKKDYRHHKYSMGEVMRDLKGMGGEYLYEIGINYENFNFDLNFGKEIQATLFQLENDYRKNPLTVCWQHFGEQPLQLHIHFWKDYLSLKEADLLANSIIFILNQFEHGLEMPVERFDTLTELEHHLLGSFEGQCAKQSEPNTIVSLFEEQVQKTPEAMAVVYEEEQVSYEALNMAANRLAKELRARGVKEETCVPVCMERGIELIIGILAILKAGGAYVPVDAGYPLERIQYVLNDLAAPLVLADKQTAVRLQNVNVPNLFVINDTRHDAGQLPADNLPVTVSPQQLAYVIYTSGSTGKPKGVMVEHRNVVSLVKNVDYLSFDKEDVLLSTGSPSFDATTL